MKKNLTGSQRELLMLKNQSIQNVLNQARALQAQFEETVKKIAFELKIEGSDYANWKLSPDGSYFEKAEVPPDEE